MLNDVLVPSPRLILKYLESWHYEYKCLDTGSASQATCVDLETYHDSFGNGVLTYLDR